MKKLNHLLASFLLGAGMLVVVLSGGCTNPPSGNGGQSGETYYNGMELLSVAYFQKIRACEAKPGSDGCEDLDALREKFAAALCAAQEVRANAAQPAKTPQAAQVTSPNGGVIDQGGANRGFSIGPVIPIPPPGPSPCQCEIDFSRIDLLFPQGTDVKSVAVAQDGKVISRAKGKGLGEGFTSFSIDLKPLAGKGLAEVRFETGDGPVSAFIAQ